MAIYKRMMTVYGCERCPHEWIPRSDELPTVCPKCKSPYWNTPKQNPSAKRVAKTPSRAKKT